MLSLEMFIQVIKSGSRPAAADTPNVPGLQAAATGAPGNGEAGARLTRLTHAALAGVRFNHDSPVPLYTQIRELLRERIMSGSFRSEGLLPSENEMVKAFGVSRITVRQALNDLQKEGLVFKIHGKGTFVTRAKAVQSLMRVEGFGEAMSGAGHETFSRVLGHRVMRAGSSLAARLQLADGAEVVEIRRLRFLDRNPISLDVTYVPPEIGRRLFKEDLVRRDIFEILDNDYGFPLERAELKIDAMTADAPLAQLLAVAEGAAVMRIERLTYTANDRPIDFEYLYFRGASFQYHVRVGRRRETAARPGTTGAIGTTGK